MKFGEPKPTLVDEKVQQTQEFAKGMKNSISKGDSDSDRRLWGGRCFSDGEFE
jgi:hypothetical protein